jgi:hypothetical protein
MLTLYSDHISPRLKYICQAIFEDLLDVPYRLTDDQAVLKQADAALNYSNQVIADVPFIRPHALLYETGVRAQQVLLSAEKTLFPCESDFVAHDVLASAFFMLSRYEEYLEKERDSHGRFKSSSSLMGKSKMLHRPLVDHWTLEFYKTLQAKFHALPSSPKKFSQLSTFDIDVAYAYKGRSWWRRTRSSVQDFFRFKFARIKERKSVLRGDQEDPFDSYSYLQKQHTEQKLDAHFFFLLGDYGQLDKSLSYRRKEMERLIVGISTWAEVGVHPSMASNEKPKLLLRECKRLEKLSGKKVDSSRQHFLYLDLPITYRQLIAQGIEIDFTMGYADHAGFRAGTSHAFRWYDLMKEETTPLFLLPLSYMDASLMDYQGLNPQEAKQHIALIKNEVKAVNGTLVSLWHNNTVSDYGEWKGWQAVFESSLD